MKKKIFAIIAAMMMMAAPAMAQIVILDDEEYYGNRQQGDPSLFVDLPGINNSGEDWYTPVGEGIAVLTVLAGAYLVGKRKKD